MSAPLLRMTGIAKGFPGVQALDGVDFSVDDGEVHALLGENGAGKSTLLKILAGAQPPDRGTITFTGETVELSSPLAAQQLGIVTIYQEFNLVPTLSVAENIFIGREPVRFGLVDWRRMNGEAARILADVGLKMEPQRLVADLSVAEQQMVEIARALSMESRLIIMDEPTSALSDTEVLRLFGIVAELKSRGIGIVFVTHRLDEVMRICDRITVLRDGRLVGGAAVADIDVDGIIRMMVGRDVDQRPGGERRIERKQPALEVRGLSSAGDLLDPHATRLEDIDLRVFPGEILGLAGLVGAGRTELARAVFGADPFDAGTVLVDGREISLSSPNDAIKAGIGLVPEDRKQQALFLALAVRANLAITAIDGITGSLGLVSGPGERELVTRFADKLQIKMAGPEQPIATLSGGNQQKVVLARWLALEPKSLIVDEPTRGIDVAAKAEVHQLIDELAAAGMAVIVISSELPEILRLADRIVTMREGRITGEVMRTDAGEERLMALMTFHEQTV